VALLVHVAVARVHVDGVLAIGPGRQYVEPAAPARGTGREWRHGVPGLGVVAGRREGRCRRSVGRGEAAGVPQVGDEAAVERPAGALVAHPGDRGVHHARLRGQGVGVEQGVAGNQHRSHEVVEQEM